MPGSRCVQYGAVCTLKPRDKSLDDVARGTESEMPYANSAAGSLGMPYRSASQYRSSNGSKLLQTIFNKRNKIPEMAAVERVETHKISTRGRLIERLFLSLQVLSGTASVMNDILSRIDELNST